MPPSVPMPPAFPPHDLGAASPVTRTTARAAPPDLVGAAGPWAVLPGALARVLSGPTGLGVSAIRPPGRWTEVPAPGGPRQGIGPTGLGTASLRPWEPDPGPDVPRLYCPDPVRDDAALGQEVNERLVAWIERVGIYPGRLAEVREAGYGRLMMLTHPDTDDPERIMAAARCIAAEFAIDDHYSDDERTGRDPAALTPLMCLAQAVNEPVHPPARYVPDYERGTGADPVLTALRSAFAHLAGHASPAQVARLRHEIANLLLGMSAEAGWRATGRVPPVWEYLAGRQLNSFAPGLALIDVVGGYELPAHVHAHPGVRRATILAALATTLVNDLYSLRKEQRTGGFDYNLPVLIAAEDGCSLDAAFARSVEIHNELVRAFEATAAELTTAELTAAELTATGDPLRARYLAGLWAWMGGNRHWHATSGRYHGHTP